ncbi:MAG: squalene/phytoene synthase family protein [Caulobacterales bacterium]
MSDLDDLDTLVRQGDPDRWLSSRFIDDARARADVIALYAFDRELARARRAASSPLLAEMRLTWWSEALDEIYGARSVRRHPTALALAEAVHSHALQREPLEAMIEARIEALEAQTLDADDAVRWADAVGGSATALAARMLDAATSPDSTAAAGRAWGLTLLVRSGRAELGAVGEALRSALAEAGRATRGLSVAAFPAVAHVALARRDLAGRTPSDLAKRLHLLAAMLRGRV